MIKAILFDFNGVIIDDEPLQLKAIREALLPGGINLTEKEYYDSLGMDDRTFVSAAFERAGKTLTDELMKSIIERKTELHRQSIEDELPFFPGVETFIKATARHFMLGLVSMSQRSDIDYVFERARLGKFFRVIVSAENVTACKPDPSCYVRALELLNNIEEGASRQRLPEECLVIEDSPAGVEAARRAGMRTLAVTNTVTENQLRDAGAEVVTASLADWTVDAVGHVFESVKRER